MANDATVMLTGNLTGEPTRKVFDNNQVVVSFNVAVNTTIKKNGGDGYEANYYNVSMYGKQAEWLLEKLQKGTSVEVVGELQQQTYVSQKTGQEGKSLNVKAFKVTPRARFKGAPTKQKSMDPDPNELPY